MWFSKDDSCLQQSSIDHCSLISYSTATLPVTNTSVLVVLAGPRAYNKVGIGRAGVRR